MNPFKKIRSLVFKNKIGSGIVVVLLVTTSLSLFDFVNNDLARARPEQRQELRYIKKKHSEEKKSLKALHRKEMTQAKEAEKMARRQFFAENKEGEKRRAYVQEYVSRMKALEQKHKDQWIDLKERHRQELSGGQPRLEN